MKKLTIIGLALILTPFFFSFSHKGAEGIFEFETEIIDYGTIIQHSDGYRTFTFTNKGVSSISINRIKPSCGCTGVTKPDAPVVSGKSGEIGVRYDTKRLGVFNKTITVFSNASEQTKTLRIKGKVVAEQANTIKPKAIVAKP